MMELIVNYQEEEVNKINWTKSNEFYVRDIII